MSDAAVLTGDVVGSTRLDKREAAKLGRCLSEVGAQAGELALGPFSPVDVFRGDAWQMVVRRPADALAVALRFRLLLRWGSSFEDLDTRVSIGVGPVDRVPREHVSRGDGPAFRLSGRGLDAMPRGRRMAFHSGVGALEAEVDTVVGLIDALFDRWTAAQARAVDFAMLGWTQSETAEAWEPAPITQQGVNGHLQRAGWPAIERALRRVEGLLGRAMPAKGGG